MIVCYETIKLLHFEISQYESFPINYKNNIMYLLKTILLCEEIELFAMYNTHKYIEITRRWAWSICPLLIYNTTFLVSSFIQAVHFYM